MKKTALILLTLGITSSIYASYSYECSRYVNGKWKGYVKVSADSKAEAVRKAYEKYEKMGERVDSIHCK